MEVGGWLEMLLVGGSAGMDTAGMVEGGSEGKGDRLG